MIEQNARIALVTFGRSGQNGRELSVEKGQHLEILESEKTWWKCRNVHNETGFVPSTIVKVVKYQEVVKNLAPSFQHYVFIVSIRPILTGGPENCPVNQKVRII